DAGEGGAGFLAAADFDAEFLFQAHDEFEGVDGVEAEAAADQGFVVNDVRGGDIFEAKGVDHEGLELVFERIGHDEKGGSVVGEAGDLGANEGAEFGDGADVAQILIGDGDGVEVFDKENDLG